MEVNNDDEETFSQLHNTLSESITHALSTRRPLLTHLNADTTWLLSVPYPATSPSLRGRQYYHILIDPWLQGPQSDVAAFFSQQWHAEPSRVQTIAELELAIQGIEDASQGHIPSKIPEVKEGDAIVVDTEADVGVGEACTMDIDPIISTSQIDAVVISHEFTDHMHKDTLLEIPSSVPVFASTKAASIITSWKHFDSVSEIPRFKENWRSSSLKALPEWISVSRLAYAGTDLLYYHAAIMVCFPSSKERGEAEAVIYTPHGISPKDLTPVASASPKIHSLALLHGLQDISLTKAQLNLGAHNGLKAQRLLGAKYWIGTHDEVKKGGGIVSWFLDRKIVSLQDAIEREKEEHGESLRGSTLEGLGEVRFEAPANGESLILE